MERGTPKVGRGRPIGDNGVYLDGHTDPPGGTSETGLSQQFGKRRLLLANHLKMFRHFGKTDHEEW